MVSDDLLAILRCPENGSLLERADAATVDALNRAITSGTLKNRGGDRVERQLDGGLVRADRTLLYPVIDQIPVLLVDESIELGQLASN